MTQSTDRADAASKHCRAACGGPRPTNGRPSEGRRDARKDNPDFGELA